jgi:DNA repair exonuclease SbcCD nuclease subunit
MALRFVHCSDIHLLDLDGVGPLRFLNKRLTGAVNLALHRRKAYAPHLFDKIVASALDLGADRLVVTGDVTNLALEAEFELVRRKFGEAGLPVTVIPGNHDAYTKGAARSRRFERYLGAFMEGERASGHDYPFVQRFGGGRADRAVDGDRDAAAVRDRFVGRSAARALGHDPRALGRGAGGADRADPPPGDAGGVEGAP